MHCCSDNPTSARQYASRFVRDCAHISARPVPHSIRPWCGWLLRSVFNTLIVGGDLVGNLVGRLEGRMGANCGLFCVQCDTLGNGVAMSESAYIRCKLQ